MLKVTYQVGYLTGDAFEYTDYITSEALFDDNITTTEIKEELADIIFENFGDNAWLGEWEVKEL